MKLSFYKEFNSELVDIVRLGRLLVARKDVFVYGNNGLMDNPCFETKTSYNQATDIQGAIWIDGKIRHLAFDWCPSDIQSKIIESYCAENNCSVFKAVIDIDFFGLCDMLR